ncbi:uncharacterized protein BDR25DRAFT_222362 [Lindgomyces ingoldianus]|uniref:Uncharacterized protein n=1 Tax=Lindgomyces ingoldianus TaxID=673940 RepID=A0ACB6QXE5_9PLEO|nr:uncharacterized protein BDR25DRAFT_222362 [Lindgomyces ingoldianus]KAF2471659.1 hypothetical protein BDR25DRAFT_222362 [Lindgomyces ingoldianus]
MRIPQGILLFSLFGLGHSHFVLQKPTSLGFDDDAESTGPCGGFTATDRSKGVTDWPIAGSSIEILTTHTTATWNFKAALVSNTSNWVPLTPPLIQTAGVGTLCEPQIPGLKGWVGKPAVLQVSQSGHDGNLYQCAAIQFVTGGLATPGSSCTNSTGIAVKW